MPESRFGRCDGHYEMIDLDIRNGGRRTWRIIPATDRPDVRAHPIQTRREKKYDPQDYLRCHHRCGHWCPRRSFRPKPPPAVAVEWAAAITAMDMATGVAASAASWCLDRPACDGYPSSAGCMSGTDWTSTVAEYAEALVLRRETLRTAGRRRSARHWMCPVNRLGRGETELNVFLSPTKRRSFERHCSARRPGGSS
jgi:hypothetical protein